MDLILLEEIQKGNIRHVKYLLDKYNFSSDSNWTDYVLLKTAIRHEHKDIAKLLLEKGARINKLPHGTLRDTTPLHLAISIGSSDIFKILLDKGASLSIANNNNETPLILAALMENYPIVDHILSVLSTDTNQSRPDGFSHLHVACMRNRVDIVKRFIENKANINASIDSKSSYWPGYTALHFAVEFQCLETVKLLINHGADITAKNGYELTPLHIAFKKQNKTMIDVILSVHRYTSKNPKNPEGLSHFHIACTRNNAQIVDDFLQWGVDVDLKTSDEALNYCSYTPLSFAIEYECMEVIKLLLRHNPTLSSEIIALALKSLNVKIKSLIYSKFKARKGQSAVRRSNLSSLHIACINNDVSVFQDLLNNQFSIMNCLELNLPCWLGYTPLHLAVQEKRVDIIKLLVKCADVDVTAKDLQGKTALHLAFENELYEIVDLILSVHTKVKENPVDNRGLSHFHIACSSKFDSNIFLAFLENGADVNSRVSFESAEWPGYTALHFACAFCLPRLVLLLLNRGADAMVKDKSGLTPLELSFKNLKEFEVDSEKLFDFSLICDVILSEREGDTFLNTGLSLFHVAYCTRDAKDAVLQRLSSAELINQPVCNLPNWSGRTPLHFATLYNNDEAINRLLELGADPRIKDAKGFTPLGLWWHRYGSTHELRCEKLLYHQGNVVDSDPELLQFNVACASCFVDAARYYLEHGVDADTLVLSGNESFTPLQRALFGNVGNEESLIELLLENGADVNRLAPDMYTPLHYATERTAGSRIIKLLLKKGADRDVNARNIHGDTPMHCTLKNFGSAEVLSLLLESGADVNIEDARGDTPLMCFIDLHSDIATSEPDEEDDLDVEFMHLMRHFKKLQIVGFHLCDKNKFVYQKLLKKYRKRINKVFNEQQFGRDCEIELEQMRMIRLDNYTTLRDIIFKECDKMALHVGNVELQRILKAEDFRDKFPIYGYLLELQFRKGLVRKAHLGPGRILMKSMSGIELPDACTESIMHYLSNEDLGNVIRASCCYFAFETQRDV